jgi:chaperonin GroES
MICGFRFRGTVCTIIKKNRRRQETPGFLYTLWKEKLRSHQTNGLRSARFVTQHMRDKALATATKLQIKPLADRVVVKKLDSEEKTSGGIVLPDSAKEKPQQGEILAVGPGKLDDKSARQAMEVKVGDKVLFAKYSGTEVKIEGVEYLILAERDILAIIG